MYRSSCSTNGQVNMFNEKAKGNAFNDVRDDRSGNTWASLPGGSNLVYADQRHMVPAICKEELDRLVGLHKWWNSLHGQGNDGGLETPGGDGGGSRWAGMESPGGREKDMTLDQVANGMFFNAVVKVCPFKQGSVSSSYRSPLLHRRVFCSNHHIPPILLHSPRIFSPSPRTASPHIPQALSWTANALR